MIDFWKLREIFEGHRENLIDTKVDDWTIMKNIAILIESSNGYETLDTIGDTKTREIIFDQCESNTKNAKPEEVLLNDFMYNEETKEENEDVRSVYFYLSRELLLKVMKDVIDSCEYNYGELASHTDEIFELFTVNSRRHFIVDTV